MTLPTATIIRTATTTEIQSQSGEEAIRARHLLQKGDLLLNRDADVATPKPAVDALVSQSPLALSYEAVRTC